MPIAHRNRCVLIIGSPGSGKGTQCELLVKRLGYVYISTGDLLRNASKSSTDLAIKAQAYMGRGEVVPDDLVIGLLKEKLSNPDINNTGWLLDGFPRTIEQAIAMKENDIIPDKLIILDIPDDVVIDRISGRRIDPVEQKIYHEKLNPAPIEIEKRLIVRKDDKSLENTKARIQEYHNNINLIRDFYGNSLSVEVIDALNDIEEVYAVTSFPLIFSS